MKTIFGISYFWPPDPCTRAIQSFKTIRGLCAKGVDVRLLAAQSAGSNFERSELGSFHPAGLTVDLQPSCKNRLADYLFRVPDGHLGWRNVVRPWIRNHLSTIRSCAAVFTIAQPFTTHLVGREIKRTTRGPWVAFFSDPWSDNPYLRLKLLTRPINRLLERGVVRDADALVFVTEATRKLVMAKYDRSALDKTHVIPHAFTPAFYPQKASRLSSDRIRLVHLGNLYGLRSPEPLFKAMAALVRESPELAKSLLFVQVGNMIPHFRSMVHRYGLESHVEIESHVSYLKSLEKMSAAEILLLIEADLQESVFLPSKLVDYIGAGRPVFGITPPQSESAHLIRRMGGMLAAPSSVEEIRNCLAEIIKNPDRIKTHSVRPDIMQQYRDDEISGRYVDLFESVIHKAGK